MKERLEKLEVNGAFSDGWESFSVGWWKRRIVLVKYGGVWNNGFLFRIAGRLVGWVYCIVDASAKDSFAAIVKDFLSVSTGERHFLGSTSWCLDRHRVSKSVGE